MGFLDRIMSIFRGGESSGETAEPSRAPAAEAEAPPPRGAGGAAEEPGAAPDMGSTGGEGGSGEHAGDQGRGG